MTLTTNDIYLWLEEVKDPEIPVLSLVDLGVVSKVSVEDKLVRVVLTPTFVGCPALEVMKNEIIETLQAKGIAEIEVEISFREPWSSDKISEKGRVALKNFGLAPPPASALFTDLDFLENTPCPKCESTDTELRNPFGPTLCRSIHYCNNCREAFEQFKPV